MPRKAIAPSCMIPCTFPRAVSTTGVFSLSFESTGAFRYILEASDTLINPEWEDVLQPTITTAAGEIVSFDMPCDESKPARFFRVRVEGIGVQQQTEEE